MSPDRPPLVRVCLRGDLEERDVLALLRDLTRSPHERFDVVLDMRDVSHLSQTAATHLARLPGGLGHRLHALLVSAPPAPVLRALEHTGALDLDGGDVLVDLRPLTRPAALQAVLAFYACLRMRDWDAIRALLAPDVVWRTPSIISAAEHHGPDEVIAFLADERFAVTITAATRLVQDGQVVLVRGAHQLIGHPGRPVAFRHAWHFCGGRLQSLVEHMDASTFTSLYDGVAPGRRSPGPPPDAS